MRSFILVVLICTLAQNINAQYATPNNFISWTPDSLVTYSGGAVTYNNNTYTIHQNLTLSTTDTLKIYSDAVFQIATDCTIIINGTLLTNPPQEVVFTAVDSLNRYKGFLFENTTSSVLNRTRFEFAGEMKLNYAYAEFNQCTFRRFAFDFSSGALNVFQSSPLIRECLFISNDRSAIMSPANSGSSPRIIGNRLIYNDVSNGNYPQINLGAGGTDSIIIQNNYIEGLYPMAGGIALSTLTGGSIKARVQGNTVFNNRYGIACIGNNISGLIIENLVYNNNIQNNPSLGGSGLNFNGNTTNRMIVRKNTIYGNLWGVTIQGNAQPMLGDLSSPLAHEQGQNRIYANGNSGQTYALYNNTPQPILAENNFWGSVHPDTVETFIFHQPDNNTLGQVDYKPFWDTINAPSLFVDTITLQRDTLHVGDVRSSLLALRNIGNQNLVVTLKDTFGIQSSEGENLSLSTRTSRFKKRSLSQTLQTIRRQMQFMAVPATSDYPYSTVNSGSEAIVVTDPASDYLGRTHSLSNLTYPDITSVDLSITSIFGSILLNCNTTYHTPIDTNIVGIISLDTDQDFMTGMFPPLAGLGIAPTDVGSEYEIIFTTKPSLYFQSGSVSAPAVLIRWLPDSVEIAGFAANINRSGNQVGFSILATPIDNDNKINLASAFIEVDSTFDIFNFEDYTPAHAPDLAPDIGHGRLGTEKDPAWLGIEVLQDTLMPVSADTIGLITLGAAVPGNYQATVILRSNDSRKPVTRFPYYLTLLPERQPVMNNTALMISDTLKTDSTHLISAVWSNTGEGNCKFFLTDTLHVPWLKIYPRMGNLPAGNSATINFEFNATGLTPGTYSTLLFVLTNDTLQTVVTVPVQLTVISAIAIHEPPGLPAKTELVGNYPNPFNPSTLIRYDLDADKKVTLKIYNILGQEVRTLVNAYQKVGKYSVIWDGKDQKGKIVSSGVYVYRFEAGNYQRTRKMIMLR